MKLKKRYKKVSEDYFYLEASSGKFRPVKAMTTKLSGYADFDFFLLEDGDLMEAYTGHKVARSEGREIITKIARTTIMEALQAKAEALADLGGYSVEKGYKVALSQHIVKQIGKTGLSPRYKEVKADDDD